MSAVKRFPALAAELVGKRGPKVLAPLPKPDELSESTPEQRHAVQTRLRVELYALASILADAAVQRAQRERPNYPPYGLARSMHSQSRMLVAEPEPFPEGGIGDFIAFGRALLDTMVFHLDRVFKEDFVSDRRWRLERLEELLVLFRVGAGPATRARMKDGFSFMYGGMQFGVSVCVQLTEVMTHLLESRSDMTAAEKGAVMAHSLRPAYRLAALNVTEIVPAYQRLISRERGGLMDPDRFVVTEADGGPLRVDLRDEELVPETAGGPGASAVPWFPTQGCPARSSATGATSAIGTLWRWCTELALELGLVSEELPPDHVEHQQDAGEQEQPA